MKILLFSRWIWLHKGDLSAFGAVFVAFRKETDIIDFMGLSMHLFSPLMFVNLKCIFKNLMFYALQQSDKLIDVCFCARRACGGHSSGCKGFFNIKIIHFLFLSYPER